MVDAAALQRAVTGDLACDEVWLRREALELRCLVWGAESAPAVLLVHGNGGHAHWWDTLVPLLAPGRRLLVPDLRGHGRSGWPEPPAYRVADFAADLLAILDACAPEPLPVVAHSMGGRAAAWLAAHHPERVSALALLDTRLSDLPPDLALQRLGKVQGRRSGPAYPSYAAARQAFRFVPDEPDVAPCVADHVAHHAIAERGPGEFCFGFDRAVLALEGNSTGDFMALLPELRCPVRVAYGQQSGLAGLGEPAAVRRHLPGASLGEFPGAHHFFLAHPEPIGAWLREFLEEAERAAAPGRS